jgi:hypothetical protein
MLTIKEMAGLIVISLLVCWTRHNGFYVVIPSLIFSVLSADKHIKKQIRVVLLSVFCISLFLSKLILPLLGIASSSPNEMMSIPYQQTARYVIMHSDEITDEERKIISTSIDYDRIPELYNPELSDPIKWSYSYNGQPSKEYLMLWFKMFFRHPLTYFSATFHNTYGYYYPFANFDVMTTFQLYTKGYPVASGDLDIHYVFNHSSGGLYPENPDQFAPQVIIDYATAWRSIPFLRLLTRPGVYTWALLTLSVFLIEQKQYGKLAILAPPLFLFLTCLVSPVNGLLRYAMPYMAVTPLLWANAVHSSVQKPKTNS